MACKCVHEKGWGACSAAVGPVCVYSDVAALVLETSSSGDLAAARSMAMLGALVPAGAADLGSCRPHYAQVGRAVKRVMIPSRANASQ